MREILFRGKRIDDGEWLYGHYVCQYGADMIYLPDGVDGEYGFDYYHIDKETVGQYTGLTDKNGKRIFEGDIIKATGTNDHIGYVTFEYGKFIARCTCHPKSVCDIHPPIEEVIGNIHEPTEKGGAGNG